MPGQFWEQDPLVGAGQWPGHEITSTQRQPAPVAAPPASPILRSVLSLPDRPAPAPTGFRYKSDGSGDVEPIPGGPQDVGSAPLPGDPTKQGPEYLATLPQNMRARVQQLIDGRSMLTTREKGQPFGQMLMDAANQADPTFDESASRARYAARLQFTGQGKGSQIVQAADRFAAHVNDLYNLSNKVPGPNLGMATLSNAATTVAQEFDQGDVAAYNQILPMISGEIQKLTKNGSATVDEGNRIMAGLQVGQPRDVRNRAIAELVSLGRAQMQPMHDAWESAWNGSVAPPMPMDFSPSAQAVFDAIENGKPGLVRKQGKDGRDHWFTADGQPIAGNGSGPGAGPRPNGSDNQPADPGTVNSPTNADVYANGLQWGNPSTGAFDRDAYLTQNYGLKPGQEQLEIGFWTANAGNANLTPDAVKSWYTGHRLPPPSDEDIRKGIADAQKGVPFQGIDTTAAEKAYTGQLDAAIKARGDNPESTGETIGTNMGQGITLNGLDELSGIAGGVRALARGQNPVAGYQAERDINRREQDRSEAAHPVIAPVATVAGGLLTAPLAFGEANTVADAVKAGTALGAVGGFNSGRGFSDSLGQAAFGAAAGAGITVAGDRAASALASRAASKAAQAPSEGAETLAAATRLNDNYGSNIQPMPADVSGGGIRNVTGGMAKFPASAQPIIKGAKNVTAQAQRARDAIAATIGNASATPDAAGEAALKGAQKFIQTSKTKVAALYAKARQLGGDEPVDLAGARQVLDDNIAELSQTPGGAPGLAELKSLRAELNQPFPVEGVKRMRTVLRDRFMSDGLRNTDLERRVGQVVDSAQQDVVDSLSAAGKAAAAKAYAEATAAHAERVGVIDSVIAPIIGKNGEKSAEQVFQAIGSASKTKGAQLGRFLNALPKEDAADVRATLISRLGQVSDGRQNAAGDVFSLSDFLTHWNQMSDTAKVQLFGRESRSALNDLAKVAEGTKEAQRFGNFSNTGGVVGIASTAGMASGAFAAPWLVAKALAVQYGAGRLLASPRFARWLAKMPKNPAAAAQHVRSLTKLATADSVIAADALGLQQQLMLAFSGTTRAAAQPSSGTATTRGGTR